MAIWFWGKKEKQKKCVSANSEMHSHILQGWCKAHQKCNKVIQESQEKVTAEIPLPQGYANTVTTVYLWLGRKVDAIPADQCKPTHSKISLKSMKEKSSFK